MEIYLALVKFYRRRYPALKLRTEIKPLVQTYSTVNLVRGRFVITFKPGLCETAKVLLLPHELAHCLSWDSDRHPSDHGPAFGLAYSQTWQDYLDFLQE